MDINLLRIVVTVLSFISFVGIWGWAWNRKNQARFSELSRVCIDLDRCPDTPRPVKGYNHE